MTDNPDNPQDRKRLEKSLDAYLGEESVHNARDNKSLWMAFLVGGLVGMIIAGAVVYLLAPSMLIVTEETTLDFDESASSLRRAIKEQGWTIADVQDVNKSLNKQGIAFEPRVRVIKYFKGEHISSILSSDCNLACLMPSSMALWQGDDGKVYLSRINTALVGRIFGGNIGKVMTGPIARDEKAMLKGLLRD